MNFKYEEIRRNSFLSDKEEIVVWQQNYLRKIKEYKEAKKSIYYLDKMWINASHTTNKIQKDSNVTSSRRAFLDRLSTGLKNLSGKGKRLIISRIGSDRFVDDALWIFESTNLKKVITTMKKRILLHLKNGLREQSIKFKENSVIVMDNTSCHSQKRKEYLSVLEKRMTFNND